MPKKPKKSKIDQAENIGGPLSSPDEAAYDPGRPHEESPEEKPKEKVDDLQQEPNVYDGDWYPEPKVDNQIVKYPTSVKSGGVKSYMLDMSKPDDTAKYDELLNYCLGPRARANIFRDREFFSETQKTVCILITVEQFLFRPILQNEPPATSPQF